MSGLDTDALIEALVGAQKVAVAKNQARQAAFINRVSALGELASRLSSLRTSARSLAEGGARQLRVASNTSGFSASPSSEAVAGTYTVAVERLATAAKVRSEAVVGADAEVRAGTLTIRSKGGDPFTIEIEEGDTLSDVVRKIRESGAPVSAAIVTDGKNSYLSVTNKETGHAVGSPADSALVIEQTLTGSSGVALFGEPAEPGMSVEIRAAAQNAVAFVDGMRVESSVNTIEGAVPGTTLTLKATSGRDGNGDLVAETLVIEENASGTKQKLQSFLDTYNNLVAFLKAKTNPGEGATGDLSGESLPRSIGNDLQKLLSFRVGDGAIRTLADLGVKLEKDGTLTLDGDAFAAALEKDAGAVDSLFRGGLADELGAIVDRYTDPSEGYLVQRQESLNATIESLREQVEKMEERIERTRDQLVERLAFLETQMAQYTALTQFLDAQELAMKVQANR